MTHNMPPITGDFLAYYNGEFKEFIYEKNNHKLVFNLPFMKISPTSGIYVLNILGGDPINIYNYAWHLFNLLVDIEYDAIVSAEGKSLPLVYEMARQNNIPYIIFRKIYKPYLGKELGVYLKSNTITTNKRQALYLDNKDLPNLVQKKLLFIDDVMSTGATLKACEYLVNLVGGQIIACACIALENNYKPTDDFPNMKYVNLINLPIKEDL